MKVATLFFFPLFVDQLTGVTILSTLQLEDWEAHDRKLANFIRTKARPHIFYLPAKHNNNTLGLLDKTVKLLEGKKGFLNIKSMIVVYSFDRWMKRHRLKELFRIVRGLSFTAFSLLNILTRHWFYM